MSTVTRPSAPASAWMLLRATWDRLSVYLPIMLMGLMAMGTYWLARNTPTLGVPEAQRPATHAARFPHVGSVDIIIVHTISLHASR